MEHSFVEEHDVVARYIADRLPEDEVREFEAHYLDCPACLEELEVEEGLRAGLREIAMNPPAAAAPRVHRTPRARLVGMLAAAALVVLAAGSTIAYVRTNHQLAISRDQTRAMAAQYQGALARADALERSQDLSARLAKPPTQVPPVIVVDLSELPTTRSANDRSPLPPTVVIADPASVAAFTLRIDDTKPYSAFRATVENARGVAIWRSTPLHPASASSVGLTIPATVLPPGSYRIVLEAATRGAELSPVAAYSFGVQSR